MVPPPSDQLTQPDLSKVSMQLKTCCVLTPKLPNLQGTHTQPLKFPMPDSFGPKKDSSTKWAPGWWIQEMQQEWTTYLQQGHSMHLSKMEPVHRDSKFPPDLIDKMGGNASDDASDDLRDDPSDGLSGFEHSDFRVYQCSCKITTVQRAIRISFYSIHHPPPYSTIPEFTWMKSLLFSR